MENIETAANRTATDRQTEATVSRIMSHDDDDLELT